MSRWTDRIKTLKPKQTRIAQTLWIDGERARMTGRADVPLASSGDVSAALKAIEALAPNPSRVGLNMMRVVVGAPFARYFVLPWQPLAKPADWVSLARMQFVQSGVSGVDAWRFAVADGPWMHTRLAVAMPEALCAGIARLCKTRKLLLLGIEPAFTYAMSTHSSQLRDGVIAVMEVEETSAHAGIAHIGLRAGGQWRAFFALPVPDKVDDTLRDALALSATPPPERCYVIGPGDATRWIADASRMAWLAAPWDTAA